ncbi:hypothetical protein LEP1GSC188_1417 [Leptospira weilii serovar Topaz str. LT2116]|uniref:Uncharacterized protein n=1 Tax=Leptospira weilii serovar Topaz str. LT2116 TaxID=1088540 RepID=M3H3D1_9LEPT|nr:hypothetical protein LEP1GSC188_1417 [Leptospira weilii serovar Topaz str. LT2116]
MITEKDLTDEVIAKDVLKWEHNPEIGWLTRSNSIEELLPSFKTDSRWPGLLWDRALPIMQKNYIGLESIEVTDQNYNNIFFSSSINSALALIVLNKDELWSE